MAGDGGILPGDGGAAAIPDVEGLGLGVQNIALRALDLPESVPAILQFPVDIHIALVVAGVLTNGVALGVREQERHAVNALAGHAVHLVDDGAASLPVGDLQSGGLSVLHLDLVGRIIQPVALGGFQLHHLIPALFRFGQVDNTVAVRGVGADDLAVQLADFKLHALDALSGFLVLFDDGEAAARCVVEAEGLYLAGFDLDRLGCGVQDIAFRRLDLPCGDSGARGQVIDDNAAMFIGDELAVAAAHYRAGAVGDKECDAFQRSSGALNILLNDQGGAGGIGKMEGLCVVGGHNYGLGPGGLVDGIAGDGLGFRDHQGSHHAVDNDFTVLVGDIKAVAADLAVFSRYKLTCGSGDAERHPRQRLAAQRVPLINNQGSRLGVFYNDGLRIAALPDDHIGAGAVHDVPSGGLDLRQHIRAGGEVGDLDLTLGIGGKDTVLRKGAVPDHAVQPYLTARRCRYPELRAGKGLAGGAVPLLDNESALWLILKGEGNGAALLDLDGLALGVQDETVRGASFRHHHALAGFQTGDADLAVLVGAVDAVAVSNQGPIGIHDLELGVGQGHAGVGGADLADQQDAVRRVVKTDGDNALLPAVRQIYRFRCVDNGIPVRRVYFLHDIGPAFQPGPNGGAVFPSHFLTDGGAARAADPTQILQLEGTAG